MSSDLEGCAGVPVNPDISGPGVRIALYLQSFLSIVLVRVSPKDAPGAYWAMTSTAMSLIICSLVTGVLGEISLLDAIIVVYVLILPIVASAFGISQLASPSSRVPGPTALRRAPSPLLILANWLRSALTYTFALFVWITAPTFGSGPATCNDHTKLIFFGVSLPALRSGRILNLVGWGLFTLLFLWRSLKGLKTLLASFSALLGSIFRFGGGGGELIKPKDVPKNVLNLETYERYNYATEARVTRERAYRPGQVFHEMVKGVMNQILGLAPAGSKSFYGRYGQFILAAIVSIWAIVMTELELRLNDLAEDVNSEWSFGQILPLILTISPLLSLSEALLAKRASGPLGLDSNRTAIRFTIAGATNLTRATPPPPLTPNRIQILQLKGLSDEGIAELVETSKRPTAFVVLTIDEKDIYTTFDIKDDKNPLWQETFEVEVQDVSVVVVRVFDLKSMGHIRLPRRRDEEGEEDNGSGLVGYTTLLPAAMLWGDATPEATCNDEKQAQGVEEKPLSSALDTQATASSSSGASRSTTKSLPLVQNGKTVPGMSIQLAITTDLSGPIPPPIVPSHRMVNLLKTEDKRSTTMIKFRGRRWGHKEARFTETYNLPL